MRDVPCSQVVDASFTAIFVCIQLYHKGMFHHSFNFVFFTARSGCLVVWQRLCSLLSLRYIRALPKG